LGSAGEETGVESTARRAGGSGGAVRGGDRRHRFPGRTKQVFVRLSKDEYDDISAAAGRIDLTPTGYVAEAALAAARGHTTPVGGQVDRTGVTRAELAQLQRELFATRTALNRVGANLNQAVAAPTTTGTPPARPSVALTLLLHALQALDTLIAAVDRRLQ
jgi:hypothetical protein